MAIGPIHRNLANLMLLEEKINRVMDDGNTAGVMCLDFAKA